MTSVPTAERITENPFAHLDRERCEALGLLACPHCGGAPSITGSRNNPWRITCKSCGASSSLYDTDAEAAGAWNRRAGGNAP